MNFLSLKHRILSLGAPSIIGLMLTFLWLSNDFLERFFTSVSVSHNFEQYELVSASPSRQKQKQMDDILALYQPYYVIENETDDSNDSQAQLMSEKEQAAQNGTLSEFFVKDYKVLLKGVIKTEDGQSALLSIENIKTSKKKLERFQDGEKVHDYTLQILANTNVQLSTVRNEHKQVINLRLFKVASSTN